VANDYHKWVASSAEQWGVQIVDPDGRRDDFVDPYFQRAKKDQVVVIIKARKPAGIMTATGVRAPDEASRHPFPIERQCLPPMPVMRSYYKNGFAKHYVRDHDVLRFEAATNNVAQDYNIPKGVADLDALRTKRRASPTDTKRCSRTPWKRFWIAVN
jgi:hypothetical protein